MQGSLGDTKNIELAKLIYGLRQNVDLYRIIGLNVEKLQAGGVSNAFWAHLQRLAHESIALTVCKIYEVPNGRYDLNSILGVTNSLPEVFTDDQAAACSKFAHIYNPLSDLVISRTALTEVVNAFRERMVNELSILKTFRDKIGAHSEAGAKVEHMSSLAAYDKFFEFADGFYRLVARQFIDVVPALIGTHVGFGAIQVMEALGVKNPQFDFSDNDLR